MQPLRFSDLAFNYAGTFAGGAVGLALPLLVGSWFGASALGVFTVSLSLYLVFSQLAAFGIHLSLLTHFAQNGEDALPPVFWGAFLALVPVAAAISMALVLLSRPLSLLFALPGMRENSEMIGWAVFFFACNKLFLAALNARMRLKEYAVYSFLRYFFLLVFLCVLHAFGGRDIPLGALFLAGEALLFPLLLFAVRAYFFPCGAWALVPAWIGGHLRFGSRAFVGHLLLDANSRVDVLCLGCFADSRAVGIYSMAAVLAEGAYQIGIVLRTAYTPVFFSLLREKRRAAIVSLAGKLRVRLWTGMGLAGCAGVALYPFAMSRITGDAAYGEGVFCFAALLFGVIVASGYAPVGFILAGGGFPGHQSLMTAIVLSANLAANLVLVPLLGPVGAACGTGAASCLSAVLLRHYARRRLNLDL